MTALAATAFVAIAQDDSQQYGAKAKFLSITPGFVEWPASTFRTPTDALQICVHGDFSFGTSLAEFTRGATVGGHRMEVKWIRKEQELPNCQIVFVSRSAAKRYDKVLEALKNSTTLTIGEDPSFLQAGGMLNLQAAGVGVSFDVNLDAINEGHLKLSAQFLSLARHILRRTETVRN